jgi:hypothetical protein
LSGNTWLRRKCLSVAVRVGAPETITEFCAYQHDMNYRQKWDLPTVAKVTLFDPYALASVSGCKMPILHI